MSKYNPPARVPLERTQTFEGGKAVVFKPEHELVLTAAVTYAGEDTFYESAKDRTDRLVSLVHEIAGKTNVDFPTLVSDLRSKYNIRSAAILIAAEYARWVYLYADNDEKVYRKARQAVDAACQRADEPAEFVAYWQGKFGTQNGPHVKAHLPKYVKRGLADACVRLYNQRSALKWDSSTRAVRMGDVLNLVHPQPKDETQTELFKFLLDQRHHKDGWDTVESTALGFLQTHHEVANVPQDSRRQFIRTYGPGVLNGAGFTWERLSSWLPGGMDKEAWEWAIPQMGVMALLRNLRNFDQAGISDGMVDVVIDKITSAEDVQASRIFPYRAYTAYAQAPSDNWKRALNKTVDLASASVPQLDRTLCLIDMSGSMQGRVSSRSVINRVDLAALQALSVAKRSDNVDVVLYGVESRELVGIDGNWRSKSVLNMVDAISKRIGIVGHATFGHSAIHKHFNAYRHDRVIMFTDDQQHDDSSLSRHVPEIITFNLGGYAAHTTWGPGRYTIAGFSDQVFATLAEILKDR